MVTIDPRGRLLDLAGERGVSLTQLSALIGRNAAYLQQFVRKGSPRKLEENDRRTLARFLGVAEVELGGPEGKSSAFRGKVLRDGYLDIPRLPLDASAGPGAFAAEERPFDAFRFSAAWLREQGLDPATLSVIAVSGDSMEPLLRDGDEILVARLDRPWQDGIHVVRVEGAVLVKRIQRSGPGMILLHSENPAYGPIEHVQEEVEVIGRVVWKSGRL